MSEKYVALLKELDEQGGQGLDLSPGDPVCRQAASAIRALIAENQTLAECLVMKGE